MAILLIAVGLASAAPLSAVPGAHRKDPVTLSLAPIVGVRDSGSDNCFIGPASGTNCPVTIVINGTGLPTADPSTIGVEESGDAAILTVEANNDSGSRGWLAGRETDRFSTCKIIIGASTDTQLILQVGNLGPTCPNNSIHPGDSIQVTLFNPDTSVFGTQTTTAAAPPEVTPNVPVVPTVSDVNPPYGPVTGGTNTDPATGRVTVSTSDVGTPLAVWFGVVATSDITAVDATHFSVVPPPSPSEQDNEGISVQFADSVNGMSPQRCLPLLPSGCADEFMYLSEHSGTFTSPPLDFNLSAALGGQAAAGSVACGVNGSTGHSTGLTIDGSVSGGPVGVDATFGVSKSAADIPETFVGSAKLTVENPIDIRVALTGTVSGCEQIALPDLAIPGIAGFYVVVGGSLEAHLSLTITINKGTYTLGGSFIPGSNDDDVRGVTVKSDCVDADGNPTTDCVTTKFEAGLSGTLAVSPLWLQIGPDFANVGAGLTAAATGSITIPPLTVNGDICVVGNWVAQVNVGPLSGHTGGAWLGPFNIAGDGSQCPYGDASSTPTATTTGLVSSSNPSSAGQEVTYTASVVPTPDGGTVSFSDGGTDIASCQSVPVDASGNASCAVTYPDAGTHPIVAVYSGDAGFAESTSATLDQVVSSVVTSTATGLVSSSNPSSPGQQVTYTASVSPPPDGGTVSFTDGGVAVASCQSLPVDASGNASCAVTYADPGAHSIVAVYSGDAGFPGSTSATLDQVVSAGLTATTTGLVSSASPADPGQPVTYTATVGPTPDGGTVSFSDGGVPIATCQAVALDASGNATCTVTYTDAGTHSIVAVYSGDAGFSGSTSTTLDQVVNPALTATTTGLTSSSDPSAPGQVVTYTATVGPTPDGGTVSFSDGGVPIAACQSVPVDGFGNAVCAVTYTDAGSHPIVAVYSGDATFEGSTSATLDQVVSATLTATATALVSSSNPSAPGQQVTFTASVLQMPAGGTVSFSDAGVPIAACQSVPIDASGSAQCAVTFPGAGTHPIVAVFSGDGPFAGSTSPTLDQVVSTVMTASATELSSSANPSAPGQQVTYTATVSPTPATGTVSFSDGGVPIAACQSVPIDGLGNAVCAITYTGAGTHPIVAMYSGDLTFDGSTSATLDQVVTAALTATATGLSSSSNPSAPGQQVTYTATVGPTPDGGTVSFSDGGVPIGACQSVPVDGLGNAVCSVTYASAGTHPIVAAYSGDAGFAGSTSATLDQVVSMAPNLPTTCVVTGLRSGPPPQQDVTVADPDGIASIFNIHIINGSVHTPTFTSGTPGPVVLTATKTDQTKRTFWEFDVTDSRGITTHCV